jgi:hypothetical protein
MVKVFRVISNRFYKWPYLAFYTLFCAFHMWFKCTTEIPASAFIYVLTTLVDWVAVFGFVNRRPFFGFQFWRWWFVWSLVWFLFNGYGKDMILGLDLNPFWIGVTAIGAAYYFTFFSMLYAYAYVEKELWRY